MLLLVAQFARIEKNSARGTVEWTESGRRAWDIQEFYGTDGKFIPSVASLIKKDKICLRLFNSARD